MKTTLVIPDYAGPESCPASDPRTFNAIGLAGIIASTFPLLSLLEFNTCGEAEFYVLPKHFWSEAVNLGCPEACGAWFVLGIGIAAAATIRMRPSWTHVVCMLAMAFCFYTLLWFVAAEEVLVKRPSWARYWWTSPLRSALVWTTLIWFCSAAIAAWRPGSSRPVIALLGGISSLFPFIYYNTILVLLCPSEVKTSLPEYCRIADVGTWYRFATAALAIIGLGCGVSLWMNCRQSITMCLVALVCHLLALVLLLVFAVKEHHLLNRLKVSGAIIELEFRDPQPPGSCQSCAQPLMLAFALMIWSGMTVLLKRHLRPARLGERRAVPDASKIRCQDELP